MDNEPKNEYYSENLVLSLPEAIPYSVSNCHKNSI